jgi:catechol 2,3-dioxygenase-like lactoylglutathione lyase family enzyme
VSLATLGPASAPAGPHRACTVRSLTGVSIEEITLADEPAAWEALGFALDGRDCHVGSVTFALRGADAGRGIVGWSLRGLDGSDLDGLATSVSERPLATPPVASEHPNGAVGVDHVVAMSPSLDRTVAALRAAGLDLRRIREEPTAAGAPRQAFFRLADVILEVVQEPAEIVRRQGGPDRPARLWGLALLFADLPRAVEMLGSHAGPVHAAVQPGREIATVRRSAGLSVPMALMSRGDRAGAHA